MQETIDDLMFENMDWSRSQRSSSEVDKVYQSLWHEMNEKLLPSRFMNEADYDEQRVATAIEIYGYVQSHRDATDQELRVMRNRAIDELGIVFSTARLYNELMEYCDVKIYEAMVPFDAERVGEANRLCAMISAARYDIRLLEKVEEEARGFIERRKDEIEKQELERKAKIRAEEENDEIVWRWALAGLFLFCFVMFFRAIANQK